MDEDNMKKLIKDFFAGKFDKLSVEELRKIFPTKEELDIFLNNIKNVYNENFEEIK